MAYIVLNHYQIEIDGVVYGRQPDIECLRCNWEGCQDELKEGQCPGCGGESDFVKWEPDEDDWNEKTSDEMAEYYVGWSLIDALVSEEFESEEP